MEYFKKWQNFVFKHGYIISDNIIQSRTYFVSYEEFIRLSNIPFKERTKIQNSNYFKLKGEIERFAQNNRIQTTGALIVKLAIIYFMNRIIEDNLKWIIKIVNQIHDEIVVECPKELSAKYAEVLKECMLKAGNVFCKTIPMKVDPLISDFWTKD